MGILSLRFLPFLFAFEATLNEAKESQYNSLHSQKRENPQLILKRKERDYRYHKLIGIMNHSLAL